MDAAGTEMHARDTQHGLLVAMGQFARETGLLAELAGVRIPQKIANHQKGVIPQTKLIEFTAGLLAGIEYLQDLSLGAQPIAKDLAVAEAWGQVRFVHFTNVGRMLEACDADTRADMRTVVHAFTQPFLNEALADELLAGREIEFDVDLMGQAVSTTSETYPETGFGWMGSAIRLGYQVARVCVLTRRYGRIWLDSSHHPGNTVSVSRLPELMRAAEVRTGLRPRRRPELVTRRIAVAQRRRERAQRHRAQAQDRLAALKARLRECIGLQYHLNQVLPQETRPSHQARLEGRLRSIQRRLPQLARQRADLAGVIARHHAHAQTLQAEEEGLRAWQAQLEADNLSNPNTPICVCRADAGFGSGENLTWLIEMGYQVELKGGGAKLIAALKKRCRPNTVWTRVGENAELTAWSDHSFSKCPYPLTIALERFTRTPRTRSQHTRLQYGVLLTYRDTPTWPTLPAWFAHYNQRQTIEAGNKQTKTVHHVQHLMSRAKIGIEVQVLLTELACNFTHFIQPWLRACAEPLTPQLATDLCRPKIMVRVLANSAACVQRTPCSTTVAFAAHSSLPDVTLCLHGLPLHQLNLGLFRPMQNAT